MAAYLILCFILNYFRFRSIHHPEKEIVVHVFDAATFSGSVVVLAAVVNQDIFVALGNTKPFLLIAGFAGVIYSVAHFFPKSRNGGED